MTLRSPSIPIPISISVQSELNQTTMYNIPEDLGDHHTTNLLPRILHLCQQKWICDFLFNPDPAHLPILTAPLLTDNALTAEVSFTRLATPPTPQKASLVFIPAFSVTQITAGFGMRQTHPTCQKTLFRYIRNDTTGAILIRYDTTQPTFHLDYLSHISTTTRLRATLLLLPAKLHSLLSTSSGALSPSQPLHSLLAAPLRAVTEHRTCPICTAPPALHCTCKLNLPPPRHSLDFRTAAHHMTSHAGTFTGVFHNAPSQSTLTPTHDKPLVRHLTRWAISHHLAQNPSSPLHALLPAPAPLPVRSPAAEQPSSLISAAEDLAFLTFDSGPSAIEHFSFADLPGSPAEQLQHTITPAQDPAPQDFAETLLGLQMEKVGYVPPETPAAPPQQRSFVNMPVPDELVLPPALVSTPWRRPEIPAYMPGPVSQEQDHIPAPTLSGESTSSGRNSIQSGEKPVERSPYNVLEDALLAKERKMQLKRERNRASAKRSNDKKKRENQQRKLEKRMLGDREILLRAEEQRLRTENLKLRKLLYGSSGVPGR